MWTLDELNEELPDIRARLQRHREALQASFVERDDVIDLMSLSACAQEPLLLVGAPGTAKSDLVRRFTDGLRLADGGLFEYMLTKFTEPSEILGPIDLDQLKEGRFIRRTRGKLPEASVVFLDEVFQSNSAILNSLLTVLNERVFHQDGQPLPVRMKVLFAASNGIPRAPELDALNDRFILKVQPASVQHAAFDRLIDAGIQAEGHRQQNTKPWASSDISLDDYLKLHRFMELQFAENDGASDREAWFPPDTFALFRRILRSLQVDDGVFISDRKAIKLYKLLRTQAVLRHGGVVEPTDLRLLAYIGNRSEELAAVHQRVHMLLDLPRP